MADIDIRPFTESDEPGVIRLWVEVFKNNPPWNVPAEDIRRKLAVQRELFFVATVKDAMVGTAMAGYDGHRGWVYYLAVSPAHRRLGIGRALIQRVEQALAELGCNKLNLQVRSSNRGAVAFRGRGQEGSLRGPSGKLP